VQAQQRAYALGEHVLATMLERDGISLDDEEGERLAKAVTYPNKRELLVALGEGKVDTEQLGIDLAAVKGIKKRRKKALDLPTPDKAEGWFALRDTDMFRFRVPGGQRSGPNARAALAQLGFSTKVIISPEGIVPGDRLVGIMRPGSPIIIYPIHSDALVAMHDSDVAWIDVRWDIVGREDRNHKVVISMLTVNKPGALAQISSAIAAAEANIHNLVMRIVSPDFHKNIFELEVKDLAQLTEVLSALKLTHGLSQVRRATVAEAESVALPDWDGDDAEKVRA
jgi:GTP diphosphokinase / guanosine-3',5'-bis(diphosphate) 3'-diphosphatase